MRKKVLNHRRLPGLFEQKAVVAVRRLDDVQLDVLAERAKRAGHLLGPGRRIQPVRAERDQERPGRHPAKRVDEASLSVLSRQIEVGQRPRRIEVGVRIEALHERLGLMPKVVFDLEFRLAQRVADVVSELQPPAELVAQRPGRQIRDVADHPRDAHARVGLATAAVVVAALPRGVGHDGVPGNRVPRDALRQQRVRAGNRDNGIHLIGIQDGPLERLHAAERSARDGGKPLDPKLVEKGPLGTHHVGHGNHGKRPDRTAFPSPDS